MLVGTDSKMLGCYSVYKKISAQNWIVTTL
jgi:hypothetical protein